jgi:hypothetical protein
MKKLTNLFCKMKISLKIEVHKLDLKKFPALEKIFRTLHIRKSRDPNLE